MNLNPQEQPKTNIVTSNFFAQGMANYNEMMIMGRNDHERSSVQHILQKYQQGQINEQEFAKQIHDMKEGKQDYN